MPKNRAILANQPGGWTLIVLLVVIAIIALLMALYLPSVLQMSSTPGKKGTRKPTIQHVKDQLAPIEKRNKQLEDALNSQTDQDQEQTEQVQQDQENQEDPEDDYDQ